MIGGGWSELTWIMLVSSLASSNKTLTATGNTSNMCRLSRVVKLFSKCCYIKMQENKYTATNKEGIKHAAQANIFDRIEIKGKGNSFITLKYHKENFLNQPTT